MATTNVGRLGWSFAGLAAAASVWVACVSTAGSRTDIFTADGGTVPTESGVLPTSSSSSSGGMPAGSSSSGGAPPTPDLCGFPDSGAATPTLYSGAPTGQAQVCVTSIPLPRNGNWFSYHDATTGANDAGLLVTAGAGLGGCGGTSTCAYHAYGPSNSDAGTGFAIYGAGVGFDLNDVGSPPVASNYDASVYTGVQFWAKGTTVGTRGPSYALSPQTIHLKLVTATNRSGDDYGAYCTMLDPTTWTLCRLDFVNAKRDGFSMTVPPATDMFDVTRLQKIQFELSLYSAPAGTTPVPTVMFDIWVDEVSFY